MNHVTERAQEMFAVIEKYLGSDLKRKEFCDQENLTYSTFHWWYHQYRKRHFAAKKSSPKDFIQIHRPKTSDSLTEQSPILSIEYPNGVVLRFSNEPDIRVITELVKLQVG